MWVGYPNKLIPMTTDFNGGPVLGGTFPALIWHDFMTSALQIDKDRAEQAAAAAARKGNTRRNRRQHLNDAAAPQESGPAPSTGATSKGTPRPARVERTASPPRRRTGNAKPAPELPPPTPRTGAGRARPRTDAGARKRIAERAPTGALRPGEPRLALADRRRERRGG